MDTTEAANIIMRELRAVPQAAGAAPADAASFCDLWPKAKPILEVVAGLVILFPALGATAGAILKGLIGVGDKIAEETCK